MQSAQRRIPHLAGWTSGSGIALAGSLQLPLFVLSLVLYATGVISDDLDIALAGVTCLFASNVIYGFMKMRDRLLFLFLHMGIFLFLLTRPLFCGFFPDRTWFLETREATWFALDSIFLSMVFLFLGCVLYGLITSGNERARKRRAREGGSLPLVASWKAHPSERAPQQTSATDDAAANLLESSVRKRVLRRGGVRVLVHGDDPEERRRTRVRALRVAAFLCYLVCFVGACADGAIKMRYMSGLPYEQFYLIDSSQYIPGWIDYLYCMTPFMLCAYLATMPKKKPATFALLLYILQTIPMLKIGSRADFVIAFLFLLLYYAFRAAVSKDEVWISKRLVIFLVIVIPVLIFAMGLMNYTREVEGGTPEYTAVQQIADALYKQGVSFTVLGHGYIVNNEVQELGFKFFSMGGLIDTFTQGFIGQTFFGFTLLPSTNSPELALYGNSYAHTMSFFAHPNYLGGEGYGSSYILELFADFGYAGIAVGSLVISMAFVALSRSIGRSWFWGTGALVGALSVFHMPRGYADEWISYIWNTRFWVAIVLLLVVTAVLELSMRSAWAGKIGSLFNRRAAVARVKNGLDAGIRVAEPTLACVGDRAAETSVALAAEPSHAMARGRKADRGRASAGDDDVGGAVRGRGDPPSGDPIVMSRFGVPVLKCGLRAADR